MNSDILRLQQQIEALRRGANFENRQEGYNPFDNAIRKAIESAKHSLRPTEEQENKALRKSMLSFAKEIGNQQTERGVLNNIAKLGRAGIPALETYDDSTDKAMEDNTALANQLIDRQNQREERNFNEIDKLHKREMQEKLLQQNIANAGFDQNYKNQLLELQRQELGVKSSALTSKSEKEKAELLQSKKELNHIFDVAEQKLNEYGNKSNLSIPRGYFNKVTRGDRHASISEQQAEINTLGRSLQFKLFSANPNLKAASEFLLLPTISIDNDYKSNLATLKTLKQLAELPEESQVDFLLKSFPKKENNINKIEVYDPLTGETDYINQEDLEEAMSHGLRAK